MHRCNGTSETFRRAELRGAGAATYRHVGQRLAEFLEGFVSLGEICWPDPSESGTDGLGVDVRMVPAQLGWALLFVRQGAHIYWKRL